MRVKHAFTNPKADGVDTTIVRPSDWNAEHTLYDEFETVAALVADTGQTYSNTSAGDYIRTSKEGFSYEVAASGASDHHLSTAGGLKLYVKPGPDGRYNFLAFNPAADGTTDDYSKFQTALTITVTSMDSVTFGPHLYVPAGRYAVGQTINLKKTVIIEGQSNGVGEGGTKLIFPANCAGIIVNQNDTLDDDVVAASGSAGASILRQLHLQSDVTGGTFDRTKSGIWMRTTAIVENCTTSYFWGHGVYVGAGSDANPYLGIANLFRVKQLLTQFNLGDGFCAEGTDANAGTVEDVNSSFNEGYGINDLSFLGNTHSGHHAVSNGSGSYNSTNASILTGAYVEDGDGATMTWQGLVLAPYVNQTYVDYSKKQAVINAFEGDGFRRLKNYNGGFQGTGGGTGYKNSTLIAGGQETILRAAWENADTAFYNYWQAVWTNTGSDVIIKFNESATNLFIFRGVNSDKGFGRGANVTESVATDRLWLGTNDEARHIEYKSSAPASGRWGAGDIVLNNAPTVGGSVGWMCTTGGASPTFTEFGNTVLQNTATYDPPSLAAGTVDTIQTMTVTGAALGDLVDASFSLDLQGITLRAWVSATNTVKYVFECAAGGATVDLGSGTVKCRVRK